MNNDTHKQPYNAPTLTRYGAVKDLTASGSSDRFCPNGQPKPPSGNCGNSIG